MRKMWKLSGGNIPPKYPFIVRISPAKANANPAAKTGSNENSRLVWVGVVYFWAVVCATNPMALQRTPNPNTASRKRGWPKCVAFWGYPLFVS